MAWERGKVGCGLGDEVEGERRVGSERQMNSKNLSSDISMAEEKRRLD